MARRTSRKSKTVKKKPKGNPMVRAIVPKEIEAKLRERAAKEQRTISQMAAILIARGLEETSS